MKKQIWCTYGWNNSSGYGKILKESSLIVQIQKSEKNPSDIILWSNKPYFIKKYDTLEETINNYYSLKKINLSKEEIIKEARLNFPSYFNRKKS